MDVELPVTLIPVSGETAPISEQITRQRSWSTLARHCGNIFITWGSRRSNLDEAFYVCRISHDGRRLDIKSSFVPTVSGGSRLTRYAPVRMLCRWAAEIPVRLLWMLPASLAVSAFLKRGGGAKSRLSKVPDLRNACLGRLLVLWSRSYWNTQTYGLGIGASSSKAEARGVRAGATGV
jgi:hypothetical protein